MRTVLAAACALLLLVSLPRAEGAKIEAAVYETQNENVSVIINSPSLPEGFEAAKFKNANLYLANMSKDQIRALERLPYVGNVWLNREKKVLLDVSVPIMNASAAWNAGYNGSGIRICVLDTGVNKSHPSLAGRIVDEADFTGGNNPRDVFGHGTHVAGIAAGNDATYRGVAFGAGILNAKVCNDLGKCPDAAILKGIDWCVDKGAHILTLSLGGPVFVSDGSDYLSLYLDAVADKGKVITVAAGNSGPAGNPECRTDPTGNRSSICAPGLAHKVITVGSTDTGKSGTTRDAVSGFSSRGPTADGRIKPDVLAPGNPITSANNKWETQDDFVQKSGTSMSTPHAAGLAALMLQAKNLSPEEVKALIMNTASDLAGDFSKTNDSGAGRIDASRLFDEINNTIRGTVSGIPKAHNIFVPENTSDIRATLYWPENFSLHQNIDLRIVDPAGNTISSSASVLNTDERAKVKNPSSGYWKILVVPTNITGSAGYSIASSLPPSGQLFFANDSAAGASYYSMNVTNTTVEIYVDFYNAAINASLYNSTGILVSSSSSDTRVNFSAAGESGTWTVKIIPNQTAHYALTSNNAFSSTTKTGTAADITHPLNGSYVNTADVTVNFSLGQQVRIAQNCTLSLDNSSAGAGFFMPGNNSFAVSLSDDIHEISVMCTDDSGAASSAQSRFTVDTTPPQANVSFSGGNSNIFSPNADAIYDEISFNVTASETVNFSTTYVVAANSSRTKRFNAVANTRSILKTWNGSCTPDLCTGMAPDGEYKIEVRMTDRAGNVNTTNLTGKIILDTTPPVMLALSPANNTFIQGLNENFSLSHSETHLQRADLHWGTAQNFTNAGMDCPGTNNCSVLVNLSSLQHNATVSFYFEMADLAGNTANSPVMSAAIDRMPPDAYFVPLTPLNGTHETGRITVNMTASEPLSSAVLELDRGNESMSGYGKEWTKMLNLSSGNHTFKAYVADLAGNTNVTQEVVVSVKAEENLTSYFSALNASLPMNIMMAILEADHETSITALDAAKNYTLRFNLTGTLAEIIDFNASALNLSSMIGITAGIAGMGDVLSAFNQSGGVLGSLAWADINNALPESSYTARITFPQPYAIYFYLNGTKDAPVATRVSNVCDADRNITPCYIISDNASVLYIPSFSGAAAGNDTQPPGLSMASPVPAAYSSSSVSLTYTASDNVAVASCWYSLNSGTNTTLAGCANTTIAAAEGANTLILYANDTSGNINQTSAAFTFYPPASSIQGGAGSSGGGGGPAPKANPPNVSSSAAPAAAQISGSNGNGAHETTETNETTSMPEPQENMTADERNLTGTGPTGLVAASPASPAVAVAVIAIIAGLLVFSRLKKPRRKTHRKQRRYRRRRHS